jgi:hypothetical protein
MKKVTSIPNASRTFDALRSLGYDLNASIADLVDNSITPRVDADEISIVLGKDGNKFKFHIQDNGNGMRDFELEEAMRIGADRKYQAEDLGKFGMGMKTASLSHCNILTVVSKKRNHEVVGYKWDLNHVKRTNEGWILFQLSSEEISELLNKEKIRIGEHGTIVFWNDLFLLNEDYKSYTNTTLAANYFYRVEEQIKLYLRMVFHRFLEKSDLKISVNNDKLKPWDPFWRTEKNGHEIELSQLSHFKIKDALKPVIIKAQILPNKESFSNEENWKEAKGLLSWNESQGYYIYRANRIIRFGGWQGTRALDEHDKLARISIDITPELDQYFRITVNKAKVEFPEALFNHLKNNINHIVTKHAKKHYNPEPQKFNNKFRKQEARLNGVRKTFVRENNIKTQLASNNNEIIVNNPNGTWLANRISEFMRYGSNKDFEVISGKIADGSLWKIMCNVNEKIKVIVNDEHPFYKKIYDSGINKSTTNAVDALICSLAFGELYNKNSQNAYLFDTFKSVCSQTLEKLIKEEIL